MQKKKNKTFYFREIVWLYMKYQFITKSILFFGVFPLFQFILKWLITSTGRVSVSSGDYLPFLFSIQGVGMLLVSLIILALLVGIDINAFVILSALIKENKIKLKATQLLIASIKSLKSLCNISGIFVMLYIAFIIPLVGIGVSVSVTENLKIPNFITDVIFKNNMYTAIYMSILLIFTIITTVFIFFFHYLIIDAKNIKQSLIMSFKLIKKHWKTVIKKFFIQTTVVYVVIIFVVTLMFYLMLYYAQKINDVLLRRTLSIFLSMSLAEIFGYLGMMTVPLICWKLTDLFYELNKKEGYEIKLKQHVIVEDNEKMVVKKVKLRTKIFGFLTVLVLLMINFGTALLLSTFFDEVFKPTRNIAIIAHRGGGDLASENSIKGMEEAIKYGAKWSEIDVQRTKDGHYIINHDTTFSRVSGNKNKSIDLTLSEIQSLKINDLFDKNRPSQPIPTIEQYLDAAKGKIGLYIELKGSTADKQMVDDIVKLVKEKAMEKEIAILSLDYQLITYVEEQYPEIDTGYLYFFSIGETQKIISDILIMEEREATSEKIAEIHQAGKKAVVWTVNTDESINKFVASDVDGIITDYVVKLKEGIVARDSRSDIQVIIDSILGN